MNPRKTIYSSGVIALLAISLSVASCNKKHETDFYQSPVNLAVTSFYLKSNIGQQDLDTVFFSIDLDRKIIFNADSLRKGTDVSKVVASIKFSNEVSEAIIEMTGGTTREGEINYQESPNDSIDFTGKVVLRLKASDNEIGTSYRIKVNVHQVDSDSLYWSQTAYAQLPSRLPEPKKQKTVSLDGKAASLIMESDGTYTMATCNSLPEYSWSREVATFPFTPAVQTLTAADGVLWILDDGGHLFKSDRELKNWQDTGEIWTSLIGPYTDTVVGTKKAGAGYVFCQYPQTSINEKEIPSDFPIYGISNFVTLSNKWTTSPVAFFTGGRTAGGPVSDCTWAFDGSEWIKLSQGGIPAVEGASIIPYYNYRPSSSSNSMLEYRVWMLLGGRKADGDFNRTVYISYDNGVNWVKGTGSLQLPECIPAMSDCDNIVADTKLEANISDAWKDVNNAPKRVSFTLDGDVIVWGCPYIYLFGGYDAQGSLYNTVWKGVLMRMTFTPII